MSNVLDILLDAAKLCDDHKIVLVLVEKGVEKDRLMKRKEDEGIGNVFF